MKISKRNSRKRIHLRVRKKISGTGERPRLSVYRSNKAIYCQIINDQMGHTLVEANSFEDGKAKGTKTELAKLVGQRNAEKAKSAGIETVVFDRGGYLYHGRV